MEDSTAMTIEFLRARLLSERTISKAAKEKADQLAKRVMELEEQIRIMAIQRKKTEQAAIEAISILETYMMNDLSDAVDSSSNDDENPSGNGIHKTAMSVNVVTEDAQSSSEVEVFRSQAGNLSCKSHCKNPYSTKKLKGKQFKESQSNLRSSSESSSKYLGKLCCEMKQKDMGSTFEDKGDEFVIIGVDQPELSMNASGSQSSFEIIQKQEAGMIGNERDDEMERVLEQQAKLIGQYEAEEKAQREWERKYKENKSLNQACSEPEKQYHEPEVNGESQEDSFTFFKKIPYEDIEEKSDVGVPSVMKELECQSADPAHNATDDALRENVDSDKDANTLEFFNGHMPADLPRMGSERSSQACIHGLIGRVGEHVAVGQVHPSVAVSVTEARLAEVAFPAKKCPISSSSGKKNEGLISENSKSRPVNNNNIFSRSDTTTSSLVGKPSTVDFRKEILNLELSRTQAPSHPRPYQSAGSSLGFVLDSLQHAKISLKQELHRFPSLGESTNDLQATIPHHIQTTISSERAIVPTGSTGVFRLPNDTFPRIPNSEHKFHGSVSPFAAGYPRLPYATIPCDNHRPNIPYVGAGSSNSIGYHHSADPTDSIRYSLPYSGLATDKVSLPSGTAISIGNRFDASSQKINIPSFRRYPLPSTLVTDATPFPNRSESSGHQYFEPFHPGTEKPPPGRYSLPYSDLTRGKMTLIDRSRTSGTDARTRMHSQDQFTFNGGNGTQSNMQTL